MNFVMNNKTEMDKLFCKQHIYNQQKKSSAQMGFRVNSVLAREMVAFNVIYRCF